jgi:hypothetical protein
MKKILKVFVIGLFVIIVITMLSSCTKNSRVKTFGGSAKLELKPNRKLVNATWKDSNLWILTRQMKESDTAEVYEFCEESKYGMFEGTYTIVEVKY